MTGGGTAMRKPFNLYEYVKSLDMSCIERVDIDIREIAIVRKLLIVLSNFFYRNTTFFMNKEDLSNRNAIYNRCYDLTRVVDFSIVCMTYSKIVKDLLKSVFDIESVLISNSTDSYRHVDLMVICDTGKKYIVDPLMDLIEFQSGWKSTQFSSRKKIKDEYKGMAGDFTILSDEELEKIDEIIGYKNGMYLDDFYEFIYDDFGDFENFLYDNPQISESILGTSCGIAKLDNDLTLLIKLSIINMKLYEGQNLHGIADLFIYIKLLLKKLLKNSELEKIKIQSFFVDEWDLKDERLFNFLYLEDTRRRGIVLSCLDRKYVYTPNSRDFLEYTDTEWSNLVTINRIFVKRDDFVEMLEIFKSRGVNRNLLHHSVFLRIFSNIEKLAKENNIKLSKYVTFDAEHICVRYLDVIIFTVENDKLHIIKPNFNVEYIVDYLDEGRKITYLEIPLSS